MSPKVLKSIIQLLSSIFFELGVSSQEGVVLLDKFLKKKIKLKIIGEYLMYFENYYSKFYTSEPNQSNNTYFEQIANELNKTEKIYCLVSVFEALYYDEILDNKSLHILKIIAEKFRVSENEFCDIEEFASWNPETIKSENILLIADDKFESSAFKRISSNGQYGSVIILKVISINHYFIKYVGNGEIWFNNLMLEPQKIYVFDKGSFIKPYIGKTIYFGDVLKAFVNESTRKKTSFEAKNITHYFSNGNQALININISEREGTLISIMGVSGAGKTTLVKILSGIEKPTSGEILINDIDLHQNQDELKGIIGYVSQDDLLIEELTVYENLYYNTKLCFGNLNEKEIEKLVEKTLVELDLDKIKNLKVGSVISKVISGGQRKRLNMALEFIREPSILFLDEPTSGLSSKDSENVMNLLKEQALKGKLIFVIIHQPPSDIYKNFDKLLLLDLGGYLIYYGNPIEALNHFQRIGEQVRDYSGDCPTCGNVNPEQMFSVIETKALDDFGQIINKRRFKPQKLAQLFVGQTSNESFELVTEKPENNLFVSGVIKQWWIYFRREFSSKITDFQYLSINLLEAPLLAFFLAFFIKYSRASEYVFRENDNIPTYIFVSIIVSVFLGLTVSAEEIFKDKKILKREEFLNLSRTSYLLSKISILFIWSAIQSLLFVLVGNSILEVQGMHFQYWLILFTVSCSSNLMGLNISASLNSVVNIYIIIPLLIIPQMILGGAMFNYSKLNKYVGGGYDVPVIVEFIPARWAYEALMVNQALNNTFDKEFYVLNQKISYFDYNQNYYIPLLIQTLEDIKKSKDEKEVKEKITLIDNEIKKINVSDKIVKKPAITELSQQNTEQFTKYFENLQTYYSSKFNEVYLSKEYLIGELLADKEQERVFQKIKNKNSNEYLNSLTTNLYLDEKIILKNNKIKRIKDPIYITKKELTENYGMQFPFFTPIKKIGQLILNTFTYNIIVLWIISFILYVMLYYNFLSKFGGFVNNKFNIFTTNNKKKK